MSPPEIQEIGRKLIAAFDYLKGDTDRMGYIGRQIARLPFDVVSQAVDEYVNRSGDDFLKVSRLLAVANRIIQERNEAEAWKHRTAARKAERDRDEKIVKRWDQIVAEIEAMSDAEIEVLRAELKVLHPSMPAWMLDGDIRKNRMLTAMVYERMKERSAVA